MGATGWSYFVPYQQDIGAALEELKGEVFRQGLYEQPFSFDQSKFESQLDFLASVYKSLPGNIHDQTDNFLELAQTAAKKQRPKRPPKSIKQLLKQCGENGTHSILDIERVSSRPGFGVIAPLSHNRLLDIFGTEKPTHDMIKKWSGRTEPSGAKPLYERWEGIYIVIYDGTQPIEIYFEGSSGD